MRIVTTVKKLLKILRRRWVWQLLGVLVLIALIWFVGPLVAIGGWAPLAGVLARVIFMLTLLVLFIGVLLFKRWRANRAARELEAGLSDPVPPGSGQLDEDLLVMQERFTKAIGLLKQTRKGKRDFSERYLYELPWYVIIGPPGSGKTTLLANSDLDFPLAGEFGKDPVKGVGGTRNCDWSFTNDAVLLDTAGRYTTQDSSLEADAGAWLGFLDLLKRHRPRRPINGVLVAVSLHDLIRLSGAERQEQAEAIRQRILELQERLKVRFPVYLLITKCDLVAGFSEFFEPLRKSERAQVWGATFPLANNEAQVGDRTQTEFLLLLDRLWNQVLERVSQERTQDRRARVFGFPEQLASLRELVATFVQQIFGPNRFQTPPLLRGVYFTSATQEGTPADRLMAGLAQRFGLDHAVSSGPTTGTGRSYFINRMFGEIVFPEANLVGTDPKAELRRRWLRRTASASIVIASLGLVAGWLWSYTQNQATIVAVQGSIEQHEDALARAPLGTADFLALDAALAPLARAAGAFPADPPWSMGLGLFQGKRVSPRAREAYREVLATYLLTGVGEHLRARLRESTAAGIPAADTAEATAALLKAYLMLGQPTRLEPAHVATLMALEWGLRYPNDEALRERLSGHLQTLLAKPFAPLPLDDGLVQIARDRLAETPLWQTVYQRVQRSAASQRGLDYQLQDLIGRDGELVFTSNVGDARAVAIEGLYTIKGLQRVYLPESDRLFDQAAADAWVYGVRPEDEALFLEELVEEVENRYAQDYLAAWDSLLGSLRVRPARNIGDLLTMVKTAASPSFSPLRLVVEKVAVETQPAAELQQVPLSGAGVTAEAGKAAGTAFELAAAMSGRVQVMRQRALKAQRAARQAGVSTDLAGDPEEVLSPLQRVDDHFARLRELTVQRRDERTDLDHLITGIEGFYEDLRGYEGIVAADRAAFAALTRQMQGEKRSAQDLLRQAENLPNPVRAWVAGISDGGSEALAGLARDGLDELWRDQILGFCRSAIEGRYPFVPGAAREVKLADFARFFGPDQLLDSFFNTHLAPLVDTSTTPWRWREAAGSKLSGNPESLVQLERAARIRAAFFASGGNTPKVELTILPTALSANTLTAVLNVDGQQLEYGHGAPQPARLLWPAPSGAGYAHLEFLDLEYRTSSISGETGDWAWFRLLDRARRQTPQGLDLVRATFSKGGHSITYEVRASSTFNPLQLRDLAQFRCPQTL